MGRHRRKDFELPTNVTLEHGSYYYRDTNRLRHRLGSTHQEMVSALERLGADRRAMPLRHLRAVFAHCRKNARSRGIEFTITMPDVEAWWVRARGRCELTGIAFNLLGPTQWRRRAFAPSIDRIDNAGSYHPENCRLVCVSMNLALNEWGVEVFDRLARGWLRRSRFPRR